MDQKNAIKLLDNTFNQDFDLNRFSVFIKELFNHFNLRINENIPLRKEYHDYINQMDSLGVYSDDNGDSIEVFAVQLKKTSSRDRARTMQRNLIAKYLKNSGSNASLVAFYGDDPQDWRFSFVKIEYDLIKDEEGNLKVKEDITPARRSSFLVGKNESNHTCRRQFLSLIKEENVDPILEQLEEAFSIESVTKEFFEEYKKLFLKLKESLEKVIENDDVVKNEFKKKSIPTLDFAKKLMGQIVFIYFLQKKGWLGVDKGEEWGNGPRNFLRKLFNKEMVDYTNFFNDILEPLFYEALATPRDEDYYRHFDCKIPFLNGGLFEPINDYDWIKTEITLKNKIFEDILDVFDLYNFTIKEDEPLEKEVAVDPEMLGKVFENLLDVTDRKSQGAFYTRREIVHYMCQESLINYLQTKSDLKREDLENFIHLGDFAIDILIREIIEFGKLREGRDYGLPASIRENCNELNVSLKQIKVVDPAVGSGAFPVGMMNEIVKLRSILSFLSGEERSNYQLKLETIRDCLYGVDIDSSAVDIAKLRFWLSLIVDEENIEKIDPLPNIDHKIMCGNSLLEKFDGKKLFDERLLGEPIVDNSDELCEIRKKRDELYVELGMIHTGKIKDKNHKDIEKKIKKLDYREKKLESLAKDTFHQFTLDDDYQVRRVKESQRKLKQLDKLHEKFFNEQNTKQKKKYREEFEKIEWEFIEETLREDGNENSIKKLEEYKRKKSKPFFLWQLYFHEVFQRENPGFDIVIANPPYVGEKGNKEIFREIKTGFLRKFHQGKMDLFYFFFHLALEIARLNATISFITTNYYPTATSGKKLRKNFHENSTIRNLIDFNELKIFESAKGQHNMITVLSKGNVKTEARTCITTREGMATSEILQKILAGKDTKTDYYVLEQRDMYEGEEFYIRLMGVGNRKDDPIQQILNKITKNSVLITELCDVKVGLRSGIDKISKRHLKIEPDHTLKEDVFVVSGDFYEKVPGKERTLLKPLFKNSDIKRYYNSKKPQKYVLYSTKKTDIDKFPFLKSHLLRFKSLIEKIRASDGEIWFSIVRPRENRIFTEPKIVIPQRSRFNDFSYNEIDFYASSDVYFIINKKDKKDVNLKYVIAIINSKLFYLWFYIKGKRKGEMLELYQKPLSEVKLREITLSMQDKFVKLVNQILLITESDNYSESVEKQAEVSILEEKIDSMVYDLYELTSEERQLVENFYIEHLNHKN